MYATRYSRYSPASLGIPKGIAQQATAPFKVSLVTDGKTVTGAKINYGTMYVNGNFVASNYDAIGTATTIACSSNTFIYLRINNSFSRTKYPSITFAADPTNPEKYVSPTSPMTSVICLAYIDANGKIYDLRPSFVIDRFSFLA